MWWSNKAMHCTKQNESDFISCVKIRIDKNGLNNIDLII